MPVDSQERTQFEVSFGQAPVPGALVAYHETEGQGIIRRVNRTECERLARERCTAARVENYISQAVKMEMLSETFRKWASE